MARWRKRSPDERTRRGRAVGMAAWFVFGAAAIFTTAMFVLFESSELPPFVSWWNRNHPVYSAMFFCLWGGAALLAVVAVYLSRNGRSRR